MSIMRPTEDQECQAFVEWLEFHHLRFSHIANENKVSNAKQRAIRGAMRKKMGVRSGVPDYMIVIPRASPHGDGPRLLFIEMKRKGSVPSDVSPDQREWLVALGEIPNVSTVVCSGCDAAIAAVLKAKKRLL